MSRLNQPEPLFKEIAVANWARRQLGSIAHEMRVSQLACRLFNLTQRWHELGVAESKLLTLAALVHDVGRAEGDKGHAKFGARMVMESSALPLTDAERRRVAFLTRYHRGRVPETGDEQYLERGHDSVYVMRVLLGLLRAADGLDTRTVAGAHVIAAVRGRVISFFGYLADDHRLSAKLRAKRKKFLLLEEMLQCEIRTEWFSTHSLALVS